jgi:glycosyltransferase involved in cell wall biosynthesis
MQTLVSLILPVYNVEKDLPACLASLKAQTLASDRWELIAINDGSTDKSLGILQRHTKDFPQLLLFTQRNKGLGATRNRGLGIARGKYVCFVDSDDTLMPNYLSQLVESAENNRADVVIANAQINRDGLIYDYLDEPVWQYLAKENTSATNLPLHPKILLFQPSVWRKLYRTDFLRKNKLAFPENLIFEDMPFHFQTLKMAEWISFIKEPLYSYNDSRVSSLTNEKGQRLFDLFPIFEKIHHISESEYEGDYRLYFYLFEFRTLKWAGQQMPISLEKEYYKKMKKELHRFPLTVRIHGWFFRLKQKLLHRI